MCFTLASVVPTIPTGTSVHAVGSFSIKAHSNKKCRPCYAILYSLGNWFCVHTYLELSSEALEKFLVAEDLQQLSETYQWVHLQLL